MSEENTPKLGENAVPVLQGPCVDVSQLIKKRFTNYFVELAKKNLNKNV